MNNETNILKLKTVANYAKDMNVTPSYIYKRIKEGKMNPVIIDGVQFIDISVYPSLKSK